MPYQDGLRQSSVNLDPLAALRAPVTILLGVSTPAADLLRRLGVTTVLDLATLPLLNVAREILEAANDRGSGAVARLDTVPGGYLADGAAVSLDALPDSPVTTVRGLDAVLGQQLRDVLQIETVADLARWLPFTFARQILEGATRQDAEETDPASELVPRMGEYPTERCFYTTMLIDHVEAAAAEDLETAGAIDIAPSVEADFGFSAPAVGARLTFAQSWFAHGVTLGNLLHSVALAPGESTRIAVVDWSRRMRSSGTEAITEAEQLAQSTSHNRAVSEVQEAVATEAQSGFSSSRSTSTTTQGGGGFGLSLGPLSIGGSASAGKTKTSASSFSSSVGSRELAASMSQQVMDATQQAASSVRDRRASLVMEVSEEEHETVSTRILANYNHMHALTVQYYEVVEIYRVTVELVQVERTLFVPMKLVEFDEATIRRYQGALADAALTRRARELLTAEFGTVRVSPVAPRRPWRTPIEVLATADTVAVAARIAGDGDGVDQPDAPAPAPEPVRRLARTPVAEALPDFDFAEIARASRIASVEVVRPGSADVFLPRDAELTGVVIQVDDAMVPATAVVLKMATGEPPVSLTSNGFEWRAPHPVLLQTVSEIVVTTAASADTGIGRLTLQLGYHGALFPVTLPLQVTADTTSTVCRLGDIDIGPELLEHLRANRLHYSQAIWGSLDASTVALLLSRFTFEGRRVADQVDPQPLMIAGNYVVLRMPAFTERRDAPPADRTETGPMAAARSAWRDWLRERGLGFGPRASTEQLVPIPTGGVFAEAVLGRSNSAEKLDATRFWNWQDSPIPLAPPEIAAITMGSRAQPVDARPGQLGQPVLNIVNPTPLPDPTGVGASLAAIQNGGMFRDMSGLAATIGLAQAVAGNSAGAARSAGELATANLMAAAQRDVELRRIKAQENIARMGNPAAMAGTPRNITESAAALNTARELDREGMMPGNGDFGAGEVSGEEMDPSSGDFGTGTFDGGDTATDFMPGPSPSPFTEGGGGYTGMALGRMLYGGLGVDPNDVILADRRRRKKKETFQDHLQALGVWKPPIYGMNPVEKEIQAFKDGWWKPSFKEFVAAYDALGMKKPHKVLKNASAFLDLLASSQVRRINLFVNALPIPGDKYAIGLAGRVEDSGLTALTDEEVIDHDRLLLWKGGTTRWEGRRLSKVKPFERELWLYNCGGPLDEEMLYTLATFIGRKVFAFKQPVWFLPEFTESPAAITNRAKFTLHPGPTLNDVKAANMELTSNLYYLDQWSAQYDPYKG